MRDGRKLTEKGKLEGQELQFFLMNSDHRLQKVKSGAKLFNVVKDKAGQKPIEMIEHVIIKQALEDKKLGKEERKGREEELAKIFEGELIEWYPLW